MGTGGGAFIPTFHYLDKLNLFSILGDVEAGIPLLGRTKSNTSDPDKGDDSNEQYGH